MNGPEKAGKGRFLRPLAGQRPFRRGTVATYTDFPSEGGFKVDNIGKVNYNGKMSDSFRLRAGTGVAGRSRGKEKSGKGDRCKEK